MNIPDTNELEKCTDNNTPLFSFDGITYIAKCVAVYDGDTITVVFQPFPNKFLKKKRKVLKSETC